MLDKNRCHICFFGTAMGKWCGTPICKECLSHRIEITEDMKKRKPGEKISKPSFFRPPKLKEDSEWEWWQQKARLDAYEYLEHLIVETAKLTQQSLENKQK